MTVNDAHCHFFSRHFFGVLASQRGLSGGDPDVAVTRLLNWEAPGSPADLADRWVNELDRHDVARTALIASVPGDETSVAEAVSRHPARFVGFFMLDPTTSDASERLAVTLGHPGMRCACLFPAMHRFHPYDDRVLKIAETLASVPGRALFVHCGVLSVGVRKKLGLPSRFETRFGNPMDLQRLATEFPDLPILVPHFGAGFLREALMIADLCPSVHLDTSSSNGWIKYFSGLTLADVYRQALAVAGPDRLLFGTDSSFFPRGWQRAILDQQRAALDTVTVDPGVRARIFGGNFDRLFPLES
jgi:predicted TIM-barrel fold metal-dependent hydrolase